MASGRATPTRLCLDKFQGERPLAEGYAVGNQLGVTTAVHVMAKRARSSLLLHVHVKVVEVPLTVSESGGKRSSRILEKIPVMAAETQAVFLIGIGHIFLSREFLDRKLCVLRAVGVVAWGTALVFYRAMEFRHVPPYDLLMAAQTQVLPCCYQEFFSIAGMGGMAGSASLLGLYGRMDYLCLFDFFSHLRVALGTELLPFRREQFLVGSAVRIMAGGTSAQQGRMDALPLHHSLHIKMAGEAQLAALLEQQPLVLRLMGRVAVGAIPCRDRTMEIFEVHLVRMAGQTEVLEGLEQQLGFI